ncbi:PIG-L family deacetylase [Aureitalea marina]|uniref:LmbE family protein n=1 Tax=Aureitalea marina TaxID=930804 RepID=A0A2S7KPI0_9FLAO|nr:PIG-L family deacetylase [Aureitalea marina]PQB04525.1 LmbE family protein [Aureitalea marina]
MTKNYPCLWLFILLLSPAIWAQSPNKPSASQLYDDLQKLNFLGTALYVAAHPDDENTRLISYLSNHVKARTAYLSLTRGDGGQNLIGPEIRELLGVIRTQELLAARRTDGGEQFFTRANDFGYSKHPDETLAIWNKEEVLGDVVRAIRRFKPDVIINRFNHRNPGTTHGHHTSSAMLSMEAFDLVGDATKYPETAEEFGTWQPKRLFFNTSWWFYGSQENFDKADKSNLISVDAGTYYPSTGLSNGEIAAYSRSMHKSQGFGSTGSRGSAIEWLEFLKGDPLLENKGIFDGIDTSWNRIQGGQAILDILGPLESDFNFDDPSSMVPDLMRARKLIMELEDAYWGTLKLEQIDQLIAHCSGLFIEAVATSNQINPGDVASITIEAINRSELQIELIDVSNLQGDKLLAVNSSLGNNERNRLETSTETVLPEGLAYSAPYWLNEKGSLGMYSAPKDLIGYPETPAPAVIQANLTIDGEPFSLSREVVYKYNDPVDGEVYQPFEVLPEVTASISEKVIIFSTDQAHNLPVKVKAGRDNISGFISLQHPEGWTVEPAEIPFNMERQGEEISLNFRVIPPADQSEGTLRPLIRVGDRFHDLEMITIDYPHIPYQRVLMPSQAKVVRIPIQKKGDLIGYIEGAGDAIPESLKQIGYRVERVDPSEMTIESLKQYDALVVGIRAYNTVPELQFKQDVLMDYVKQGGTMLVQYNTNRRLVTQNLAPFDLKLSRDRVTDEQSPVTILAPEHPALNYPNKITLNDFHGWVQERGLYFPNEWSAEFTPLLAMNDPNGDPSQGSLLIAKYGKGHYIYTGLSFFRELPAGVPGAYRLFANLLSLGK